ncbi:MAG TPA: 4-hydroxy-3-methylbut-2-enyl diphosphate reductase [Armatimonadota bacterium]|nr:4-hydroxy-3-methylbut-2-enyl diphosphate reductase [Armatimonadota bacterium]
MKVVLADSLGMCFGVRDAVKLALESPRREELTILGELVHNTEVLRRLREAGIRTVASVDAPVETTRVMITAHGAAHSVVARLRERGLQVEEATCPLVGHAHRSLHRLVMEGYFPVVIGRPDHVEVRGLVGDLEEYAVIQGADELSLLAGRPRLGVVSQTTQPLDFVLDLVEQIRQAFPEAEVRFADTVCQPTKERQAAAWRLAEACAVVVVVGGRNSNNTRQLLRACEAAGARAYGVETAADLRSEWFDGVDTAGLTAGTSTPDEVIEAVRRAMLRMDERELLVAA